MDHAWITHRAPPDRPPSPLSAGSRPMTARRGRVTFPDYAARWRASREFTWEIETRRRIPGNIAYHLNPAFPGPIRAITTTDVMEWIAGRLNGTPATPRSSMKLYYDLFRTIMNSAEIDGIIRISPCRAIKTAVAFRGFTSTPRWIPTDTQVLDLFEVVPPRYHAALWLGAGQACRIGEVLAIEDSPACFDLVRGELHVRQQLQYDIREHGGFFLKEPKGGSAGTIALDTAVRRAIADHLATYGTREISLIDTTTGNPGRRTAKLLFTDERGRPFHDRRWSEYWTRWRDAARWPVKHGTFHALRHFCATTMLANGVEPQHVQKTLRHANLQHTLATYIQWLPRTGHRDDVISTALRAARQPHG